VKGPSRPASSSKSQKSEAPSRIDGIDSKEDGDEKENKGEGHKKKR
jgi:hypothetical protein